MTVDETERDPAFVLGVDTALINRDVKRAGQPGVVRVR
jgi:hypothetical protein